MKARPASWWIAWTVGIGSIAMMVGGFVLMFVDRNVALPNLEIAATSWTFSDVLNNATNLGIAVLGILLVSRRPENIVGWLFLAGALILSVTQFATSYGLHALVADPGSLPGGLFAAWSANWVNNVGLAILAFLFFLFPTGHLPSRRWRLAAWGVGAACVVSTVALLVGATMIWSTPYKQSGGNDLAGLLLIIVPAFFSVVVSFASLVVRFRASTGDERLQLKWFVAGGAAVAATFIVGTFADSPLVSIAQSLAVIFFFVAVGVAILKYRLYEIDVVISKTVLYGLLAAFFTAVYVAIVVGIGTAIGSTHNPFLTVLAATLIALAFNPARDRAKWLANRITYGRRATPYEVLSEFAEDMAGTYSLEDVLPRTAQMLAEGTGATRADVWLLSGSELVDETMWPAAPKLDRVAATNGDGVQIPGASRAVPVRHQGELLGAISIYKAAGDPVSAVEDKLLSDVASQAGLVLRNVRLVEDLKTSRQRIVAAQDEERRKIERNIHDGAQQQLVALAIKANLAKSLVGRDEEQERAMLEQLSADAQDTLENLRDLARGIYPPLLADQGLIAALEAQARKSPVRTTVEADGIERFPQEAEAAVYFCTLEALQNVAKYANASLATVRLAALDGHLSFFVQDDGEGFDPAVKGYGTGMQGMADRLAALGGELRVTSWPGRGTLVEGTLAVGSLSSSPSRQSPS